MTYPIRTAAFAAYVFTVGVLAGTAHLPWYLVTPLGMAIGWLIPWAAYRWRTVLAP